MTLDLQAQEAVAPAPFGVAPSAGNKCEWVTPEMSDVTHPSDARVFIDPREEL